MKYIYFSYIVLFVGFFNSVIAVVPKQTDLDSAGYQEEVNKILQIYSANTDELGIPEKSIQLQEELQERIRDAQKESIQLQEKLQERIRDTQKELQDAIQKSNVSDSSQDKMDNCNYANYFNERVEAYLSTIAAISNPIEANQAANLFVSCANSIIAILYQRQEYASAEKIYQQAQEILQKHQSANSRLELISVAKLKKIHDTPEKVFSPDESKNYYDIAFTYYEASENDPENLDHALKYWTIGAQNGDSDSMVALGECYLYDTRIEKNFQEAMKFFLRSAKDNNPGALYNLGIIFYNGEEGVEKNFNIAFKLFQAAARYGDAEAQTALGECYYWGEGTTKDPEQAIKWFQKAAEQNNPRAFYNLGDIYSMGIENIKANAEEAFKYYKMAAEQDDSDAQVALAKCYQEGHGTIKNITQAMFWLRKAALLGNEDAQVQLKALFQK